MKLILSTIFLLALFLRIFQIGDVPFGFHNDEVDVGYEGLYIFKNGHDTYGNNWPVYFDKFGDFRPIGLYYLTGFWEFIFGASVESTRLPSAIFGALTVILAYFLYLEIFGQKEKFGATMAAFFMAILPWHIVLSRSTQESIVGMFLIFLGFYFLFRFIRKQGKNQRRTLIFAYISLFLAFFFYTGHRFLIAPFVVAFIFEIWRLKLIKNLKAVGLLTLATIFVTILILSTQWGRGRVSQVAFFNNPVVNETAEILAFGDRSLLAARIFHNRAVVVVRKLASHYLTYFSGEFLFVRGGLPDRYVVPQQGLIYFAIAPLLLLGISFSIVNFKNVNLFPFWILLLSPIAAIFTFDDIPM